MFKTIARCHVPAAIAIALLAGVSNTSAADPPDGPESVSSSTSFGGHPSQTWEARMSVKFIRYNP